MMSTEPEILPEAFSNPHASYGGTAETFIDEVVMKSCHNSLYNNSGYYSESGSCSSSHHSLILEDPVLAGHSQGSLKVNGRNSYSHQSSFIKLIVKEASDGFLDSNQTAAVRVRPQLTDHGVPDSLDGMQIVLGHAEEEKTVLFRQDRLSPPTPWLSPPTPWLSPPTPCGGHPSSTVGYPTPRDLITSPSPDGGKSAPEVRGLEVARLEDDPAIGTGDLMAGDGSGSHPKLAAEEECAEEDAREPDHVVDQDRRFLLDVADSHIRPSHDTLPVVSKRRSYLSHFNFYQSPQNLPPPPTNVDLRKLSDPAIHLRKQKLKTSCELKRQRCLSDSEAPFFPFPIDEDELKSEEGCSSALGCDSGYHDDRVSRFQDSTYFSSPRVSLYSSDLHSQEDGSDHVSAQQQRYRRITPHPSSEHGSQSDDQNSAPTSNPGTMVHPRERSRRSMLKHFSQSSIGGGSVGGASSIGASSESPSLSSLLETQSNLTCATDILSSLGFDDFDSPQLVPDRFIPVDLEYLRPSHMKAAFLEQTLSPDPPRSPDSLTSGHSSNPPMVPQRSLEISDLPLGATAENFMPVLSSPTTGTTVNLSVVDKPVLSESRADTLPLFTNSAAVGYTRQRFLETVPEETASDLSLSPRWLSPRVSIDHSVTLDIAEGKLGASLQKPRRRSLPTREGYRLSIGSLVESDTGDSIHLSVTSYDDEIAAEREREREGLMPGVGDDITLGAGRRRRRGVYTPPQTLLSWLSTQKTIDEEVDTDPDELPWPFNEQARLRKSLTEISLAQQETLTQGSDTLDENLHVPETGSQRELSLSPISTPNVELSPQPSLSEVDMELNDLEVEGWLSSDLRHLDALTSPDSESRQQALSPQQPTDGDDTANSSETEAAGPLIPASTRLSGARPRRSPISPLNAYRSSLPHLGEGFKPLADPLRLPIADEVQPPVELKPPTSGVSRHLASEVRPPSPVANEVGHSPLTPPKTGGNSTPHDLNCTSPSEEESYRAVSPGIEETDKVKEDATIPPSPTTGSTRRPRLQTLRQASLESFTFDNLPEDMSEIELLTGDLHSPMLSTRRPRAPLKKQENTEEASQAPRRLARSRSRRCVIEAPNAAELFRNTSLSKNESEVEKYMVL